MRRALIVIGLVVLLAGLLWPWLSRIPFGRLPGDIVVSRPGFTFYFPITTSIVISIIIAVILKIFKD
ncbi:MAG: DUF2905 domain-containing protein [Desulfocapsaceae bacterium]|nr:DUF2905 domain-containing protein [Desulfocapsaceae bacterium]